MLHMAIVLEGTIFILTLDVTVDVLHEEVFIQSLPLGEEFVRLVYREIGKVPTPWRTVPIRWVKV